MLTRVTALWLFTLAFFAGCEHSDEHKLIGTWETGSIDAVWRVTFKPDHTLVLAFKDFSGSGKFEPEVSGTWQLNGKDLTTNLDLRSAFGDGKPDHQRMTETVTFVGTDKIERRGGYPYERVK